MNTRTIIKGVGIVATSLAAIAAVCESLFDAKDFINENKKENKEETKKESE